MTNLAELIKQAKETTYKKELTTSEIINQLPSKRLETPSGVNLTLVGLADPKFGTPAHIIKYMPETTRRDKKTNETVPNNGFFVKSYGFDIDDPESYDKGADPTNFVDKVRQGKYNPVVPNLNEFKPSVYRYINCIDTTKEKQITPERVINTEDDLIGGFLTPANESFSPVCVLRLTTNGFNSLLLAIKKFNEDNPDDNIDPTKPNTGISVNIKYVNDSKTKGYECTVKGQVELNSYQKNYLLYDVRGCVKYQPSLEEAIDTVQRIVDLEQSTATFFSKSPPVGNGSADWHDYYNRKYGSVKQPMQEQKDYERHVTNDLSSQQDAPVQMQPENTKQGNNPFETPDEPNINSQPASNPFGVDDSPVEPPIETNVSQPPTSSPFEPANELSRSSLPPF